MVLMQRYLPEHQFEEHHSMVVHLTKGKLLDAAQAVTREPDPLISRFIAVRELPARLLGRLGRPHQLPSRPFGIDDFTELGRNGDSELAYGLAGQFWKADYGLQRVGHAAEFEALQGTPKLVLNFTVETMEDGRQTLSTTTRVGCLDATSRRSFTPYWFAIRPVSGLIRRHLLRRIAAHAQHSTH
jgi:hypothetical protein